jgi:hypothetical protein
LAMKMHFMWSQNISMSLCCDLPNLIYAPKLVWVSVQYTNHCHSGSTGTWVLISCSWNISWVAMLQDLFE